MSAPDFYCLFVLYNAPYTVQSILYTNDRKKADANMKTPDLYEMRCNSIALYLITIYATDENKHGVFGKDIVFNTKNNPVDINIVASIDGKKVAFIFYDGNDRKAFKKTLKKVSASIPQICVVVFDPSLRAYISNTVSKKCGLLCYSDAFGFGMIFQLYRHW